MYTVHPEPQSTTLSKDPHGLVCEIELKFTDHKVRGQKRREVFLFGATTNEVLLEMSNLRSYHLNYFSVYGHCA